MEDLLQRVNDFSVSITSHSPPGKPLTAKAFQAWYLHTQASACLQTSNAYWQLVHSSHFTESIILARNLMERLINSLFAAMEDENAAILCCIEYQQHIKNLENLHAENSGSLEIQKTIEAERQKLTETKWLLKGEPPKALPILEIARRVDWEKVYRKGYARFSAYSHGGCLPFFEWRREHDQAFANWLAASAPVYSAHQYYHTCNLPTSRLVQDEWISLPDEIRRRMLLYQ